MIMLAETGDKTQLVTASLAAQHESSFTVFAASTLALWSVSLAGIFAGRQLVGRIKLSALHKAAGFMFLAFGLAVLFQALM
jgi:putative Ca2+/H+ antiporter (TMEM165/GDT1 family)